MRVDLRHGDCVELMRAMPECSVDSIVTDPPYELGFMGKAWDGAGIAYSLAMWGEALRVLKPGGHLLAFGGTRTYHRMACAIEDAGFQIRDSIHWVYGSGFPKSLNVGKAIDKANGRRFEDRYALGRHIRERRKALGVSRSDVNGWLSAATKCEHYESDSPGFARVPTMADWIVLRERLGLSDEWHELVARVEAEREVVGKTTSTYGYQQDGERWDKDHFLTAPATDEARRWEGWGTALKPAHEPVVVARKPLSGTVAGNVLVWWTGGLNIDGCRVGAPSKVKPQVRPTTDSGGASWAKGDHVPFHYPSGGGGRWPANIVLDGAAAAALDQQSGNLKSGNLNAGHKQGSGRTSFQGMNDGNQILRDYGGDSGGASRFFTQADFGPDDWPFVYQAKPSKRERNAGLDGLPERRGGSETFDPKQRDGVGEDRMPVRANHHPTVKPVALMRHLVRLVTPPGGTVLDPFAGSGTTLVAAVLEGMNAIGCEMTDEYLPIIRGRVAWAEEQADEPDQPTLR